MTQQIKMVEARAILTRLTLDSLRSAHTIYFKHLPFMEALEVTVVGIAIFEAQRTNQCATVSYLARVTGLSRASVRRRLKTLLSQRFVEFIAERNGGHYEMGPRWANPPGGMRMIKKRIALVHAASRALAKLAR